MHDTATRRSLQSTSHTAWSFLKNLKRKLKRHGRRDSYSREDAYSRDDTHRREEPRTRDAYSQTSTRMNTKGDQLQGGSRKEHQPCIESQDHNTISAEAHHETSQTLTRAASPTSKDSNPRQNIALDKTHDALPSPTPASTDNADQLEIWFDDKGLEDSSELQRLGRELMNQPSVHPPGGASDRKHDELFESANKPAGSLEELKENIDKFNNFIEGMQEARRNKEDSKAKAPAQANEDDGLPDRRIAASMKKTFKFVGTLLKSSATIGLKAAESTVFVADELTAGTHYQVAVKAILLFYNTYKAAKKMEKKIEAVFDKLVGYQKEMGALLKNIRSAPMSKAISRFFYVIVAFIVSAASYLQYGIFPKMAKQFGGRNDKLEGLLDEITEAYNEVMHVMVFAQVMVNLKTKDNTDNILARTKYIIGEIQTLKKSMPPEMSVQVAEVFKRTKFHAELHIQKMRKMLFGSGPTLSSPAEDMRFNNWQRIFLSPRNRWQRQLNLPEPNLQNRQETKRPLVWITGRVSRRNVSWVSSFSVDLVEYFRGSTSFDVAYIFCKRGPASEDPYRPLLLIKSFIAQLMDMYPAIALNHVRELSLARFQAIGHKSTGPSRKKSKKHEVLSQAETATRAWTLLEDILRLMGDVLEQRNRHVLLLIDRLDLCWSEEEDDFRVMKDLVPRLQNLGHKYRRVQVIITTAGLPVSSIPQDYVKRGSEWLLYNRKK